MTPSISPISPLRHAPASTRRALVRLSRAFDDAGVEHAFGLRGSAIEILVSEENQALTCEMIDKQAEEHEIPLDVVVAVANTPARREALAQRVIRTQAQGLDEIERLPTLT
jgi:hypothetical protein